MTEWNNPDQIPDVKTGDAQEFAVALRIKSNGQVRETSAFYLNEMPLSNEDGGCLSDLPTEECYELHDEGCPVTGWKEATPWEDYPKAAFFPLIHSNVEFLGWQSLPKWTP